jgi:hypothetical protein
MDTHNENWRDALKVGDTVCRNTRQVTWGFGGRTGPELWTITKISAQRNTFTLVKLGEAVKCRSYDFSQVPEDFVERHNHDTALHHAHGSLDALHLALRKLEVRQLAQAPTDRLLTIHQQAGVLTALLDDLMPKEGK